MKQVARQVPFEDILPDDQAKRVGESEGALTALKESIRAVGLLDPPIVEEVGGGTNKVRLRAGRSRYKAIKSLREEGVKNFDLIPCTVLEFDDHELQDEKWKEYKVSQIIFDSNDKRSQLAQIEQARHYQSQMQQFPHLFPDYIAVAKFNNKDVSDIKEVMDLLSIDPQVMVRIEELNIRKPGTIPGMCIQEIASAAAEPKRPLPAEGQKELVELLISPDLKDKRALILRDKMQTLVREVRRKYVTENRGRPKINPAPPEDEVPAGSLLDFLDGNEAAMASTVTEDTPAGDHTPPSEAWSGTINNSALPKAHNGSAVDQEGTTPSGTQTDDHTGFVLSKDELTPEAKVENPITSTPHLVSANVGIGIIEVNITNIIRTLENSKPSLDAQQLQHLIGRLDIIREMLEQAVTVPA